MSLSIKRKHEPPKPNPTSRTLHFDQALRKRGEVKHGILKTCLDGWLPCMSSYFCGEMRKLLVYVDGFAGAGKHASNEKGSPLIMCDALAVHNNLKKNFGQPKPMGLLMIFTEKDKKTYEKLMKNLDESLEAHNKGGKIQFVHNYVSNTLHGKLEEGKRMFREWRDSPEYHRSHCPKVWVVVECGEFNESMNQVLDVFAENPMFIFADPFGWTGMPLILIHKILATSTWDAPKDLLINLMDGNIRRFIDNEGHQDSLRESIGEIRPPPGSSAEGRWHNSGLSPDEKLEHINSEYIRNIKEDYERDLMDVKFAMRGKNNGHVYHLIFLCSHLKSLKQMKYSMYRYSETYKEFTFSEYTKKKGQLRDFPQEKKAAAQEVFERLKEHFDGKLVEGKDIEDYILQYIPFYFNFKVELKKLLNAYILKTDPPARKNSALDENFYYFKVVQVVEIEAEETTVQEPIVAETVSAMNVENPVSGFKAEDENGKSANASVRRTDDLPTTTATTQRQPRKRKRMTDTLSGAGESDQVRVAMKKRNV